MKIQMIISKPIVLLIFLIGTMGCTGTEVENTGGLGPSNTMADLNMAVNFGKPVVVEFYAEGNPNCLNQRGIIESIKPNYEGKVVFLKIDVNQNPEAAHNVLGTSAVPSVIIVDPSVHVHHSWVGSVVSKEDIEAGISESITGH